MKNENIDILLSVLPYGEENAISGDCLISTLNISSVRQLQKLIARARLNGAVICSCDSGYFLPESRSEVEHFYRVTRKKALSTLTVLKSARIALGEMDGQQELEIEVL